jgi:hypothetical protein
MEYAQVKKRLEASSVEMVWESGWEASCPTRRHVGRHSATSRLKNVTVATDFPATEAALGRLSVAGIVSLFIGPVGVAHNALQTAALDGSQVAKFAFEHATDSAPLDTQGVFLHNLLGRPPLGHAQALEEAVVEVPPHVVPQNRHGLERGG